MDLQVELECVSPQLDSLTYEINSNLAQLRARDSYAASIQGSNIQEMLPATHALLSVARNDGVDVTDLYIPHDSSLSNNGVPADGVLLASEKTQAGEFNIDKTIEDKSLTTRSKRTPVERLTEN